MEVLEKEIEQKLVNIVKRHGGLCLKWICPGWAGVPDRIVLLPGGKVIFVELKRPKGSVISSRQKWWADKLKVLGFEHWYVYNDGDLAVFNAFVHHLVGVQKRGEVRW